MLVRGPFISVHGDSLLDALAVQIELLSERFHHQLLQIAAEEQQAILVRKDHQVFLPFAVRRHVPHQRHQRGGIAPRFVNARGRVACRRSGEHAHNVDSLQRRGKQAHRGKLARPAANPIEHGNSRQPFFGRRQLVQVRTGHGDGDSVIGANSKCAAR